MLLILTLCLSGPLLWLLVIFLWQYAIGAQPDDQHQEFCGL